MLGESARSKALKGAAPGASNRRSPRRAETALTGADHCALFGATLGGAIRSDLAFAGGRYAAAADVHLGLRRVAALMGWGAIAPAFYGKEMRRGMGFASAQEFLTSFLEGYFLPMDPDVLLCALDKWRHGDVTVGRGGDLAAVLGAVKAKVFVMPISSDKMFPPGDCEPERKLIPGAELRVIEADSGHLGLFALDASYSEQIDRHLGELLATPA